MTGYSDERIMFTAAGALVMGEVGDFDELLLFDRDTLLLQNSRSTSAQYFGTRISAGGEYVVVADNNAPNSPIHIIEPGSLQIQPIPHGGDTLEVNWMNESDRLLAIVFDRGPTVAESTARVLSWSIDAVVASNYLEGPSGVWANPELDITIDGASTDTLFSFHWVTVGPGDNHAAISLVKDLGAAGVVHQLVVIDLNTGGLRFVDDARGPVGFTPDGSTIVSYRYVSDGETDTPYLLLVDAATLEVELLEEPLPSLPNYFVTREGNFVVVASFLGDDQLTLFDLDSGTTTKLGAAIDLHEFVSRPGAGELWLVDEGLHRLDIMSASLETIDLSFEPAHINRLPRDELVLDDRVGERLVFLDPDTREPVRSVSLYDDSLDTLSE